MSEARQVRFIVQATGPTYLDMAARLAASLRLCTFPYECRVYADRPREIPGAMVLRWEPADTSFAKIGMLLAELQPPPTDTLLVSIDADMELLQPLTLAQLDPGPAGLLAVEHFLSGHHDLWGVSPHCAAYTHPGWRAPTYWQCCLFGGYPYDLLSLLTTCRDWIARSHRHEGAWEEPYLNRAFSALYHLGSPPRTLPVTFACPEFRPTMPDYYRTCYDDKAAGQPPIFRHHNAARRGG